VPLPKPPTKWEEYQRMKGITKRKRSRLVFDDNLGEFKPRWGYQRANDDKQEWVIEAKDGDDDNAESDPFLRKRQAKKEKVDKQKGREDKNRQRAADSGLKKLPGILPINNPARRINGRKPHIDKEVLSKAVDFANVSTASIGRFDKQLPGQKPVKKKSKLLPSEDQKKEKDKSLILLDRILKKSEKSVNLDKAANSVIVEEQKDNSKKKRKFAADKEATRRIKKLTKKKKVK